jgi:hypothetical protein
VNNISVTSHIANITHNQTDIVKLFHLFHSCPQRLYRYNFAFPSYPFGSSCSFPTSLSDSAGGNKVLANSVFVWWQLVLANVSGCPSNDNNEANKGNLSMYKSSGAYKEFVTVWYKVRKRVLYNQRNKSRLSSSGEPGGIWPETRNKKQEARSEKEREEGNRVSHHRREKVGIVQRNSKRRVLTGFHLFGCGFCLLVF